MWTGFASTTLLHCAHGTSRHPPQRPEAPTNKPLTQTPYTPPPHNPVPYASRALRAISQNSPVVHMPRGWRTTPVLPTTATPHEHDTVQQESPEGRQARSDRHGRTTEAQHTHQRLEHRGIESGEPFVDDVLCSCGKEGASKHVQRARPLWPAFGH